MNSTNLNAEMKKAEVFGKARIRRFKKEDKLRILAEADQAQGTGKIHEILRREGIYSSQLSDWRRKRANGEFGPGADSTELGKKRPPKENAAREVRQLRGKVARLEEELRQTRLIIDIQKKVSALMGRPLGENGEPLNP